MRKWKNCSRVKIAYLYVCKIVIKIERQRFHCKHWTKFLSCRCELLEIFGFQKFGLFSWYLVSDSKLFIDPRCVCYLWLSYYIHIQWILSFFTTLNRFFFENIEHVTMFWSWKCINYFDEEHCESGRSQDESADGHVEGWGNTNLHMTSNPGFLMFCFCKFIEAYIERKNYD